MAAFASSALGWYTNTPTTYFITLVFLVSVSSLMSSTAQILIAIQITPSARKKTVKVHDGSGGNLVTNGNTTENNHNAGLVEMRSPKNAQSPGNSAIEIMNPLN